MCRSCADWRVQVTDRKSEQGSSPELTDGPFQATAITIRLRPMGDSQSGPSVTREQLRLVLFPDLTPEEGRLRIAAAFARAEDDERAQRVERLANDPDLDEELLSSLRRLSADEHGEPTDLGGGV